MKLMPHFRRELSMAKAGFEKVIASAAEQTARQIELLRLNYQAHQNDQASDAICERMGRFMYESHKLNPEEMTSHATYLACVSEFKRIQTEIKFNERRRYDLREEDVSIKWAEFVESVRKSGMTLETLTLPFQLSPPSMSLKDLGLPQEVLVIAIRRKERFIQPHGGVMVRRGDRLTVLGPPKRIIELIERLASDG